LSEENVEIVRRIHEAFLRGDYEAMVELVATDVDWIDADFPGGGRFHGHGGMAEGSARWFGAWEDYEVEFLEYIDAGEKVVVHYRQRGRGKGSGAPVEMEATQVWTLEGGKATVVEMYPDPGDALEAAGLSE
jgi:ketosteroid isomerase-like protein